MASAQSNDAHDKKLKTELEAVVKQHNAKFNEMLQQQMAEQVSPPQGAAPDRQGLG